MGKLAAVSWQDDRALHARRHPVLCLAAVGFYGLVLRERTQMKILQWVGVALVIVGMGQAVYALAALVGESMPYQDAPAPLLAKQAVALAAYRSDLVMGLAGAVLGMVALAIAWRRGRKR